MPRCTVVATPVVWIHIRGEKVSEDPYRLREDGGLVSRFLKWCDEQRIYTSTARCGGYTGGGGHAGGYDPADAKRVLAWLREQGVEVAP